MSEHTLVVTDADFESAILQSEQAVLVDFWATWCGPCKAIAPVLEEVAGEAADRIKIYKMDVEENSQTPVKYGIRSIPSLLIFKGGEKVAEHKGALSKTQLLAFIDEHC